MCGLHAWCQVLVSGAGTCHIVGVSLRTPGWAPWGLVLSTPLTLGFHVSCLVCGLHGLWCSFQGGLVCVNSAGVGLGMGWDISTINSHSG